MRRAKYSVKGGEAEKDYSSREISRHYPGEFYQDSFYKILQLPGQWRKIKIPTLCKSAPHVPHIGEQRRNFPSYLARAFVS